MFSGLRLTVLGKRSFGYTLTTMSHGQELPKKSHKRGGASGGGMRPGFPIATVILVVAVLLAAYVHFKKGKPPAAAPENQATSSVPTRPTAAGTVSDPIGPPASPASAQPEPTSPPPPAQEIVVGTNTTVTRGSASTRPDAGVAAAAPALPEPTPQTRQLVNSLVQALQPGVPLTQEQAAAWKQNLQQLIQQDQAL